VIAMSVAALDVGKTNVKVVLFDDDGAITAERSEPNAPLPPDEAWPYPRLDLDKIWRFALAALRELNTQAPISAISISSHGAAGVLIDEHGPSPPPMDYEFNGFGEIETEYDALRPPFEETLSPHAPRGLNVGRSVYYYERRYPELFARARAFLLYPQFWFWKLTGELASEVTSLACHGDLWRPREAALSSIVTGRGWARLFPPRRAATPGTPRRSCLTSPRARACRATSACMSARTIPTFRWSPISSPAPTRSASSRPAPG
jgi:sugar (pentulose or hexulose) kinase